MAASKQILDTTLSRGRDILESPSDSIETIFSPIITSPRREETPTRGAQGHHLNEAKELVQQHSLRFERRSEFQKKSKLVKNDSQQKPEHINTSLFKADADLAEKLDEEEDWVCPVAVALRRVGYNVPLRPSRSWLERDRKNQALLRQKQATSKEI